MTRCGTCDHTFASARLPASVSEAIIAALDAGKPASTLVVWWRDKAATLTTRGELAGRLRRAGRAVWAQKVLRGAAPAGSILVFVDVQRGCNVTTASLPLRPQTPSPPPRLRPQRSEHHAYRRELEGTRARPGVPRGSAVPK